MIEQRFEFIGDGLYVYTSIPQYGGGVCESNLVMTKDIFRECYKRWVEPQEMNRVVDEIKKVCTSQPKIGRWIDDKCSVCGKGIEDLIDSREWYRNEEPNFCPFCGVKLINSQKSEE